MPNIRSVDMILVDQLFDMGGGYVLNFSDRTFAQFFSEELSIDIDDPHYARQGTSKAKRLRCFLQSIDVPTVVRTLRALWEYREATREQFGQPEKLSNAGKRFEDLLNRIQGKSAAAKPQPAAAKSAAEGMPAKAVVDALLAELMALPRNGSAASRIRV